MSLFRQQALEQHRLPDPIFTPVIIVAIRRGLWVGVVLSFMAMAGVWLAFGTLYTTYETPINMTGTTTLLTLRAALDVSTDPLHPTRFMAACPEIVHGIVRRQDTQNYSLLLEEPVYGVCHVTLILRQEQPLERLFR